MWEGLWVSPDDMVSPTFLCVMRVWKVFGGEKGESSPPNWRVMRISESIGGEKGESSPPNWRVMRISKINGGELHHR